MPTSQEQIKALRDVIKEKAFKTETIQFSDKTQLEADDKGRLRLRLFEPARKIERSFQIITGMRLYSGGKLVKPKQLFTNRALITEWAYIIDCFLSDLAETIWQFMEWDAEAHMTELREQALEPIKRLRTDLMGLISDAQGRGIKREQQRKRKNKSVSPSKSDPYKKLDRKLITSIESLEDALNGYLHLFSKTMDYKYFCDYNPKGHGRIDRENNTLKKIRDLYKELCEQKDIPIKERFPIKRFSKSTIESNMAIVLASVDFWREHVDEKNKLKKVGMYVAKLHKRFQVIDR